MPTLCTTAYTQRKVGSTKGEEGLLFVNEFSAPIQF